MALLCYQGLCRFLIEGWGALMKGTQFLSGGFAVAFALLVTGFVGRAEGLVERTDADYLIVATDALRAKKTDDAVRLDPNDAVVHYNRGVLLQETDKPNEAEAAYREALRLDPKLVVVQKNLKLLLKQKDK